MSDLETRIAEVKTAKATENYWHAVGRYGTESHALRALDCRNRDEAIKMLAVVQTVSIFKREGKVVIQ